MVLRDGVTDAARPWRIVHCVGSRDRNYNNYCSAICCMQSLKFAHLVKERTGARVYNFYIDMRTPAKAYDEFYQHVLEEGIIFVRGKVAEVTDAARLPGEEGKLIVQVEDTLVGKQRRIPVDMVILSAGLEPRFDAKEVGQEVRHLVQHRRLVHRAAPQARPGRDDDRRHLHRRRVPGAEGHPGRGGAGRGRGRARAGADQPAARSRSSRSAPRVDEAKCSGCRICNTMCPFNAISFHEDRKVSEINPALCQGCGTCVAACPAGAITRHALQQRADPGADRGRAAAQCRQRPRRRAERQSRRLSHMPEQIEHSNPSSSASPATGAATGRPTRRAWRASSTRPTSA